MNGRIVVSSEFSRRTLSVTNILIYIQKLDRWLFVREASILYKHYQVFGLYRAELYHYADFLGYDEIAQLKNFCPALQETHDRQWRFINVSFDFPGKEEYSLELQSDNETYSISPSKQGDSPISRCTSRNTGDGLRLIGKFMVCFHGIHGYRYEFWNIVYVTDQLVFPTDMYELLSLDDALMKLNPIDKGIMEQASVLMRTRLSAPADSCETSMSPDE